MPADYRDALPRCVSDNLSAYGIQGSFLLSSFACVSYKRAYLKAKTSTLPVVCLGDAMVSPSVDGGMRQASLLTKHLNLPQLLHSYGKFLWKLWKARSNYAKLYGKLCGKSTFTPLLSLKIYRTFIVCSLPLPTALSTDLNTAAPTLPQLPQFFPQPLRDTMQKLWKLQTLCSYLRPLFPWVGGTDKKTNGSRGVPLCGAVLRKLINEKGERYKKDIFFRRERMRTETAATLRNRLSLKQITN